VNSCMHGTIGEGWLVRKILKLESARGINLLQTNVLP
jgi:hypothetical protein